MIKRAIFLASSLGALALFGVVGFMQSSSRAFVGEPRVELDSYLYAEVPAMVNPPQAVMLPAAEDASVVLLPAVHIEAAAPLGQQPESAVPQLEEATEPCSPWRELGPRYVNDGVPSGVSRVRQLC